VFIRWMDAIAAGRRPVIFGDGSQTMDFVHVTDVARANVLAAMAAVTDVAINVGSGTETSLNELANILLTVMESPMRPDRAAARKVNPVPRRLADIGDARRLIGYEPTVALENGLRQLVAWWEEEQCLKSR
jgi:UDP-glucose 4-epimerase